jgi:hypothetical protein
VSAGAGVDVGAVGVGELIRLLKKPPPPVDAAAENKPPADEAGAENNPPPEVAEEENNPPPEEPEELLEFKMPLNSPPLGGAERLLVAPNKLLPEAFPKSELLDAPVEAPKRLLELLEALLEAKENRDPPDVPPGVAAVNEKGLGSEFTENEEVLASASTAAGTSLGLAGVDSASPAEKSGSFAFILLAFSNSTLKASLNSTCPNFSRNVSASMLSSELSIAFQDQHLSLPGLGASLQYGSTGWT